MQISCYGKKTEGNNLRRLTVVVPTLDKPTERWASKNPTVVSLERQTLKPFGIRFSWDEHRRGASWARNEGFKHVETELVLFSDDDITWAPEALQTMMDKLDEHPAASYCYCAYRSNWREPPARHEGEVCDVSNRLADTCAKPASANTLKCVSNLCSAPASALCTVKVLPSTMIACWML